MARDEAWTGAARVALPTGMITPDVSVKRSLVLEQWGRQRAAERGARIQRERLAQQARAYEGAATNRLTSDWTAMNTSADSELVTSLRVLRARSRELVRDNPYATHAVRLITNNVIGNGIGMQAQVKSAGGRLQTSINDNIEDAYAEWSDRRYCHTAGLLGWADIERLAVMQLVTAGEVLLRKHRQPFGGSKVPLAVEVMEADRLLDNWQAARAPNGNLIRMGVEIDAFHRPTAYWFSPQHPGDYQFTTFEPARFVRVPAEDVIHLYIVTRWPQTRGEPWFHSTMRTLRDVSSYEEAVIVKARASANVVGFIRGPEPLTPDDVAAQRQIIDTEPGTWQRLLPGEDVAGFSNLVADPAVAPFLKHMIRRHAVGVGLSYESLSRDHDGATYSSERMGTLEDRDHYRAIQGFLIRGLRADIHREFCDAAALVGAVKFGADYYSNPAKYQAVKFKPRGWSWIDPTKEVEAYKAAVRAGFMSRGDVIGQTSPDADIEDVDKELSAEQKTADALGLVLDTDPRKVNDKGQIQPPATPPGGDGGEPADPQEPQA